MSLFNILIANHVVGIETLHFRPFAFCRDFITDRKPEMTIQIKQNDIDEERARYEKVYGECSLWDGALEVLALHRVLSERLIEFGVILIHGAAIGCNNESYLFTAASGTGKTTHILKWLEYCQNSFIVNGDKPFILINEDGRKPLVCGSPWAGKEHYYTNTMIPLKAIVIMERSEENHIKQISFAEAIPSLIQQIYRPVDEKKMRKTLKLLQRLSPSVSFWRFRCNNFKEDCFRVAYNALTDDVGQS